MAEADRKSETVDTGVTWKRPGKGGSEASMDTLLKWFPEPPKPRGDDVNEYVKWAKGLERGRVHRATRNPWYQGQMTMKFVQG